MPHLVFVFALMTGAGLGLAQNVATPEIRVSGEASVSIEPDQAEVTVGVITQAPTAQGASEANATKLDAVISAMKRAMGDQGTVETIGYTIQPNYRRPRDGGEATIVGYTASNRVRASGAAIERTGELIDSAIGAGANNVEGLRFTVEDSETARLRALGDAAKQARAKAEALADALGLQIVRVVSVEETSPAIARPYAPISMMQVERSAPPTPVEPGAIDIRANVTLRVTVSPR